MIDIDMGGLKSLGSRLTAFINGPLSASIKEIIEQDAMPNLVNQITAQLGVPLAGIGGGFRIMPTVVAGAGGITASYSVPIIENEEEKEDPTGSAMYASFPLIRAGGQLYIVASRSPQSSGQQSISEAFKDALTSDLVSSVVTSAIGNAVSEAKNR